MSTSTLARKAKQCGLPMRGRGGPSHGKHLADAMELDDAPEPIAPALQGVGGRGRLKRLAMASQYPTLTAAARAMGTGTASLVSQINRIERELGCVLLVRAERGRPMRLTDDGSEVLAAINEYVNAPQLRRKVATRIEAP
jgi:molybdenum-dependent DNA-binding transcriptional regulator ModE